MAGESMTVYGWVTRTRGVLLDFVAGLPWDVVITTLPDIGHGSIRGLLLHTAGCYRWWIEYFAGGKTPRRRDDAAFADMAAVCTEFAAVDQIVGSFIAAHSGSFDTPFTSPFPNGEGTYRTSPRWLFTHTTTHEFHHKGQVVMLSRRLGHPPVETDLWEPDWTSS